MSLFSNLYRGLLKTSRFSGGVKSIFSDKKKLDQSLLDELEELLISMGIGHKTSKFILIGSQTSNLIKKLSIIFHHPTVNERNRL